MATRQPSAVRCTDRAAVPPSRVTSALTQIGQQGGDEGVHAAAQPGDGGTGLLEPAGLACSGRSGGSARGGRRSPALGRDGGGEGTVLADAGPQTGGHHVDVEH